MPSENDFLFLAISCYCYVPVFFIIGTIIQHVVSGALTENQIDLNDKNMTKKKTDKLIIN